MLVGLMAVVMIIAVGMIMSVSVAIPMLVSMPVVMSMIVLVVMQALPRPWAARVLAEHERPDRNRNGTGRHADAPEIQATEIPQREAVNDEKFALGMELIAQQVPKSLRPIASQHDVDRQLFADPLDKSTLDAFG